jgi:basic amino acid/polyamine antiporter, APA family
MTIPGLDRAIRLPHATAMVVGTIIGASIFVQPSEITGRVPTVGGIFGVWLVCGVLTLFGALVSAELASTFPESGGVYAFLREAFGPWLGFLWAWAMFWTMHTGIIAAIATVFARYVGYFTPLGDLGTKGVAMAAVLVLSAVNYRGVRHGSVLQTVFTAGKLLAILGIIALGLAFGGKAHVAAAAASASAAATQPAAAWGAGDFALALVAGLFAFGGWHMVTYNAEETHDPRRTVPRALVIGTLVVTACYVALNAVYLYVLPLEVVATSDRVAAEAADAVFGHGGGAAMSVLVVFSTFGALAGIVLAGPRVYYAMARDGLLFPWVGGVHPRYRTPHRAVVLQAVWACVLVGTGTYRALFTRVVYTEWIFFGLMAVGLILLRRRAGVRRDYSVWGYPWVPLAFAGSAFAIVANQVAAEPAESLIGLGLVLAGLPVYHFWARRGYARRAPHPTEIP